jgi:hypothetical protein
MTENRNTNQISTSESGGPRIGFITSGGDCSGMNAAVRAIVRHAIKCGMYSITRKNFNSFFLR